MEFANSNVFSQKLREFYWTVTRAIGLGYLHDGSGYKPRKSLLPILFYPFYVLPAWILSQAGVRFIDAPVNVIEQVGHLAMDFDAYFKDQLLAHRKVIPVLLCAGRKPANKALLAHWPRNIRVIRSRLVCWLLRPLMSFPEVVDSLSGYCSVLRGASRTYDVQSRWADRAPIFYLSEAEIARGEAQLRVLGIPEGAWFVCVHSREGGYAPGDEWANSYRNTNITDYMEAMRAIVARGGWCIRVGDPTMRPLDPMPGVVDYARSSSKSDWTDLFLCASCRFFLGNSSGLFGLAGIFGKPSALANMTPLGGTYSFFPSDISIPKLMMDLQGRMLPLPDAFAGEASELRLTPEFVERGLRQVDNTPQEIAELATEMMDRLDGKLKDEPDDADLQARFRALIQPHHYCWHASAHIGRAFLRRHRTLLMTGRNLELDLREHEDLLSYKEAAGGKVRNKIPIDMSRFGSLQPRSNKFGDAMLIHIIIAVWSEKYIGLMRDYALPTLLYANNLGSVTRKHKCVLVLYCKEEEEEEINKIPTLELIRKLCEVEIVHIDPENAPNAYIAMARAHHHAAVRAKQRAAKVIFYCPDGVMANGSLERAVFLAEQGKRAVMVPGPRISEGEAELHLKPLIRIESPISPRDMLKTVFPILHPEMFRYFWDSDDFSSFPSICCWRVEGDGFLMRAFHLHAFMVDFSRIGPLEVLQTDTVDGDFIGQAIGIWPDINIEQDSDNLGLYTITPDDAFYSAQTNAPGSVSALRSAAYSPNVKPFHRYLFSHAIKMHVHDIDERWLKLEEQTGLLLRLALQPIFPAEMGQDKRGGFARSVSAIFGTRVN